MEEAMNEELQVRREVILNCLADLDAISRWLDDALALVQEVLDTLNAVV